jgi:uncharacterized protein YggE
VYNENRRQFFPIILFAFIIVIILLLWKWSNGDIFPASNPGTPYRGIMVKGEGTVSAKPDLAKVTLGVESDAKSAKEAQNSNAEIMSRMTGELKQLKITEKDIQTTDFSLYPIRKYNKKTDQDQVIGYRVSNQVTITVHDLSKLASAIDSSIKSGVTNVNSIAFSLESPGLWKELVFNKAIKDAREKANALAKAAGVKIKKVLYINDSSVDLLPYQVEGSQKALLLDKDKSTPVEPGSIKLNAQVQICFGI